MTTEGAGPLPSMMQSADAATRGRALRVSEARYRRLFEAAQDGILLLDANTALIDDINPYLIKMLGYTHAQCLGKHLWDIGAFADVAESKDMFAVLQTKGYVRYDDLPLRTSAGDPISVEVVANSYDCDGVRVIQCNIRDITAHKATKELAGRLAGLYAALSQCNHAIIHCTTEAELYPEICRIAVELGGASMAWVGLVDTVSGSIRPVASSGDATHYLDGIEISSRSDSTVGQGPIGTAIRERRPVWLQDFMHDPVMTPWRERMTVSDWVTSGAVPLERSGEVIGTFNMYSDKANFFDEAARGLLCQLARDISFALDGFTREATRRQAEESLRTSEHEFHSLAEAMPQIVWVTRPDGGNAYFNQRWVDYTGLSLEESLGAGWLKPFHPDDRQQAFTAWQTTTATAGNFSVESRLRRSDGAYRWWLHRGAPQKDSAGNMLKWFGTSTDIHDLKTAEIKISRLNRVHAVLSGINSLIVRVGDRKELFREACRIAVEAGGFRMSMMCVVDRRAMTITPVASTGMDPALFAMVEGALGSPDAMKQNVCTIAVREKRAVVAHDMMSDPSVVFAKRYAELGVRSVAVFPVMVADETEGVFALYARDAHFFDAEEMTLLTELVSDIAFAIDHIGKDERLGRLAYYDELTGLANRSLFLERVGQYTRGEAGSRRRIAVLLMDLARFKNINDTLGRPDGDALLKQVAAWLAENRGDANLIARLDADHFAVVLPDAAPGRDLERLLDGMSKAFVAHPFCVRDSTLRMSATIGIAVSPNDGADAETLLRNAEFALKKAKARGHRYLFYTAAMTNAAEGKLGLETRLREALEKDQFVLHYQPKVSLATGKVTGAEALIRWNDPRTGLVQPSQFIPSLEETGLIFEVGRWALGAAAKDYLRWRTAGVAVGRIAVNVSPIQLRDPDFLGDLERIINLDVHAAVGLEIEITEGVIMEDIDHNIASLRAIRAMGLTVAIDDFGTGFSSLSYLAKLPADTLKIDRSFITDMTQGPEGLALVSTIITLAHGLKLKVVAEAVETEEQSRLLRLLACDDMQGFVFSTAIPVEIFETKYLGLR
jgi:diguanylate cyclase (GGDEF)-like protein/PAS domain S-box-containing protein